MAWRLRRPPTDEPSQAIRQTERSEAINGSDFLDRKTQPIGANKEWIDGRETDDLGVNKGRTSGLDKELHARYVH